MVEKEKDSLGPDQQIHEQKIRCVYLPAADEPVNQSIPEESGSSSVRFIPSLSPSSSFSPLNLNSKSYSRNKITWEIHHSSLPSEGSIVTPPPLPLPPPRPTHPQPQTPQSSVPQPLQLVLQHSDNLESSPPPPRLNKLQLLLSLPPVFPNYQLPLLPLQMLVRPLLLPQLQLPPQRINM